MVRKGSKNGPKMVWKWFEKSRIKFMQRVFVTRLAKNKTINFMCLFMFFARELTKSFFFKVGRKLASTIVLKLSPCCFARTQSRQSRFYLRQWRHHITLLFPILLSSRQAKGTTSFRPALLCLLISRIRETVLHNFIFLQYTERFSYKKAFHGVQESIKSTFWFLQNFPLFQLITKTAISKLRLSTSTITKIVRRTAFMKRVQLLRS
jgi:hypothetical protein